jgi:hypothetical protein
MFGYLNRWPRRKIRIANPDFFKTTAYDSKERDVDRLLGRGSKAGERAPLFALVIFEIDSCFMSRSAWTVIPLFVLA